VGALELFQYQRLAYSADRKAQISAISCTGNSPAETD
jgi:hypothetical protein